jgi:hypothetical protein
VSGFQLGAPRHKTPEQCQHEMHTVINPDSGASTKLTCDN